MRDRRPLEPFARVRPPGAAPVALAALAPLAALALALFSGCGAGPEPRDEAAPLAVNVIAVSSPFGDAGSEPLQARRIVVTLYDVSAQPIVRTAELEEAGVPPIVRDTTFLEGAAEGDTLFEHAYEVAIGAEPVDIRVKVEVSAGPGAQQTSLVGTRTIQGLVAGASTSVDVYLTPAAPLPPRVFGVQVADSWAAAGAPEHLIPIVLANSDEIGGFQFDLSFDPAVIENVTGFEVDPDSRLYLEPAESGIARIGTNEVGDSVFRVVVFSENRVRAIAPGLDVALYLKARLASSAFSDSLRLSDVFVASEAGDSLRTPAQALGGILIIESR